MPDLGKCRYVDNKLCCWDKKKKAFFYVDLRKITNAKEISNAVAVFMDDEPLETDKDFIR